MRLINVRRKRSAWINISSGLYLFNIPNSWSLSKALGEYFVRFGTKKCQPGQDYLKIECVSCNKNTTYPNSSDINNDPYSNKGHIYCPKCKQAWLYYEYQI